MSQPPPRQPFLSEVSRKRKLALLVRHLPRASRILEVGCGDGWFTSKLRALGHDVRTMDLVSPAADVVGDILEWRSLGLRQGEFDAVVALEVIEHVDCLDSLIELTDSGGVIFLSTPHPRWDWVMNVLERAHMLQKRTSPHANLTDLSAIHDCRVHPVVLKRPMGIHQVAIFRRVRST
jgi:2-polyprenyl-3-methyl-5-hydroxy-6-metoxy-1,4-benzoquinol methylase